MIFPFLQVSAQWRNNITDEPFAPWVTDEFCAVPVWVPHHDAVGLVLMGGEL